MSEIQFCAGWAFGQGECVGKVKYFKTSDWPAPVPLCPKHFKQAMNVSERIADIAPPNHITSNR